MFDFPEKKIELTNIHCTKNTRIQLVGSKSKILWKQNEKSLEMSIPAGMKTAIDYVWVLKLTD